LDLLNFLVDHGFCSSKTEARRLLQQGGIHLDREPVPYSDCPVLNDIPDGVVLRVGRKKFMRLWRA
jgi:tyrosyl-tRNA synthetase